MKPAKLTCAVALAWTLAACASFAASPRTDEPIQLTTAQYFYGYVYNRDYIRAPLIGVNHIVRSGNALENVTTVFPEGKFVDFCFPGGADGSGWSILRMVFEPYKGEMKLSALIHSEYTE